MKMINAQQARIIHHYTNTSRTVHLLVLTEFVNQFYKAWNEQYESFPTVSKNTQTSEFMKISPVGAKLFHADRHTDITKLIAAFGNFVDTSKNGT